jgi:hypothetical protein
LQGVEVKALQAVVKAHGPDIVLLMHISPRMNRRAQLTQLRSRLS